MKHRIKLFKGLCYAFAILVGLAALSFIISNQSDDFSESENQTKTTIEISENQIINDKSHTILPQKLHEKETLQSSEKRKDELKKYFSEYWNTVDLFEVKVWFDQSVVKSLLNSKYYFGYIDEYPVFKELGEVL